MNRDFESRNITDWHAKSTLLNTELAEAGIPFRFLEGDLEYAILKNASARIRSVMADSIEFEGRADNTFVKWIGSKGIDGECIGKPHKAPWIRARLAEILPFSQLSESVKMVLNDWIGGALSEVDRAALYTKAGITI